jgi:hypothetical protein
MEIQKAGQIGARIAFEVGMGIIGAKEGAEVQKDVIDMIRARDKAIIERCKGAILASWIQGIIGTADIEYILGCVAKDLE